MNERYLLMLRMLFIRSPMKRARYMKKKGVFRSMGDRVMITPLKVPLYSRLISIGSNVWIASGVEFITHDVAHYMLNGLRNPEEPEFEEKAGCIEIGDNVFIGADTQILYDVKVGNNVIIAAGSVINKDVPSNSVVGGGPARVLGTFDDFVHKRRNLHTVNAVCNAKQSVSKECEEELWAAFRLRHSEKQQDFKRR